MPASSALVTIAVRSTLGCVGMLVIGSSCRAAPSGDLARMVPAWLERQKAVRSVHYEWEASEYQLYIPVAGATFAEPRVGPVTGRGGYEFAFDETGRYRLVTTDLRASADSGDISSVRGFGLFDGTANTVYFPIAARGNPVAHVTPTGRLAAQLRDVRVAPITLAYRAFDEKLGGLWQGGLEYTGTEETFRGQSCFVFEADLDRVWVTSDDRNLPVRWVRDADQEAGVNAFDLEVEYSGTRPGEWTIAGWTMTRFGEDGTTIIESCEATVVACKINEPLPSSLFTVEFAPGTWVTDDIRGQDYLVRADGARRLVLPGEFTGDNYDQLLNSDPPMLRNEEGTTTGLWLWIGNGVLLAAIAGFWYWRSRRAKGAADG